ncbi:MAG: PadR family transcriptional regulator [Prolixibacteraceae bacterium]|jgi:PadR family transcriptional regulator PadR|nr:PadR family transcriptional regulator [Prolixibacteraceae bacterium]
MGTNNLYKGNLTTIVLKLLEEKGRMYGYQITQEVKAISVGELVITEGALYPMLHKLEAQGLLTVETEMVGNRMRKYYSITHDGKKEVVTRMEELEAFIRQMQNLLNPRIELA